MYSQGLQQPVFKRLFNEFWIKTFDAHMVLTILYDQDVLYENHIWNEFKLDPRYRHTFWTLVIGNSTGGTVASYVCQQFKVQRYLSCKSLKEAQKCIYIAAVGILFICLMGEFILSSQMRI